MKKLKAPAKAPPHPNPSAPRGEGLNSVRNMGVWEIADLLQSAASGLILLRTRGLLMIRTRGWLAVWLLLAGVLHAEDTRVVTLKDYAARTQGRHAFGVYV